MSVKIKPKRSEVADSIPTTGDIEQYEIALNTVDKKIYVRDGSDNIVEVSNYVNPEDSFINSIIFG